MPSLCKMDHTWGLASHPQKAAMGLTKTVVANCQGRGDGGGGGSTWSLGTGPLVIDWEPCCFQHVP
eukprot:4875582-Karenia_brevis.AAC.1